MRKQACRGKQYQSHTEVNGKVQALWLQNPNSNASQRIVIIDNFHLTPKRSVLEWTVPHYCDQSIKAMFKYSGLLGNKVNPLHVAPAGKTGFNDGKYKESYRWLRQPNNNKKEFNDYVASKRGLNTIHDVIFKLFLEKEIRFIPLKSYESIFHKTKLLFRKEQRSLSAYSIIAEPLNSTDTVKNSQASDKNSLKSNTESQ